MKNFFFFSTRAEIKLIPLKKIYILIITKSNVLLPINFVIIIFLSFSLFLLCFGEGDILIRCNLIYDRQLDKWSA